MPGKKTRTQLNDNPMDADSPYIPPATPLMGILPFGTLTPFSDIIPSPDLLPFDVSAHDTSSFTQLPLSSPALHNPSHLYSTLAAMDSPALTDVYDLSTPQNDAFYIKRIKTNH